MSKVATNMKSVYELFIAETEKLAPDVDMLESLIDRLQQEDIGKIIGLKLSRKKLYKLPSNIGNLTNLRQFFCYNNIMYIVIEITINKSIFLYYLISLMIIYVQICNIIYSIWQYVN